MLNLAGGDFVDDIKILQKDEGFCKVLGRIETKGLSRKQRRDQGRRWRKEHHRSVPSSSAVFRYLEAFHDPEEKKREKGKAFIPAPNRLALEGSWVAGRMKAIRFSLINLSGRILEHARELVIRLAKGHPSLETLLTVRQRIMELGCASG